MLRPFTLIYGDLNISKELLKQIIWINKSIEQATLDNPAKCVGSIKHNYSFISTECAFNKIVKKKFYILRLKGIGISREQSV